MTQITLELTYDECMLLRFSLGLAVSHAKEAAKNLHGNRLAEYKAEQMTVTYSNLEDKLYSQMREELIRKGAMPA